MDYEQISQQENFQIDGQSVADHLPRPELVSSKQRLRNLIFFLCFLIGLILIPSLAERIVYSMTRGAERAKREEALQFLARAPRQETIIPWIVKSVGPSVVRISADQGIGTGFIIDPQGYIVTNSHVLHPNERLATSVTVRLSDGRSQAEGVRVIGEDRIRDLAVLKIDLLDLVPVPWGKSESIEVGDTVVAIGSPYGLDHSVTMGIISAKERYQAGEKNGTSGFLQTDAAVNPGNSGGPLVNLRGEVIGVNTALLGKSYQGISFAIPADQARKVCADLIQNP